MFRSALHVRKPARKSASILLAAFAAALFLFASSRPALCADDLFAVSAGFDYSSGDYGEASTTEIFYLPLSLKWESGRLTLKGTVPYLSITTTGTVIGGGTDIIATGAEGEAEEETESGLGDINLSASWFLYEGTETLPMVDLTAKVKLPTADEDKGLGTGAADLTVEADFTRVFDRSFFFGTVGYKFYGDADDVELDNVLLGSVGIGSRFTEKAAAGIIYDARQATTDEGSPMSEATAYLSYRISERFRLMTYGLVGFSDGSPDYGIGLSLSTTFALEELRRIIPSLEHPRK